LDDAIGCLSLAAKMEETEIPLILDLQVSFLFLIEMLFSLLFLVFLLK